MDTTKKKQAYIPPHRRLKNKSKNNSSTSTSRRNNNNNNNNNNVAIADDKKQKRPFVHDNDDFDADAAGDGSSSSRSKVLESAFTRVCCINLSHRPDRWKKFSTNIQNKLGNEGKLFINKIERFNAIDGTKVMKQRQQQQQQDNSNCDQGNDNNTQSDDITIPILEWDATNNAKYDRHIQPPMIKQMSFGEVGCAMSHTHLWRELMEMEDDDSANNTDATMLIFEDDAILYPRHNNNNNNNNNNTNTRKHNNVHRSAGRNQQYDHHHHHQQQQQQRSRKMIKPGFLDAFSCLWKQLPQGSWDILYLGFSDRGDRIPVLFQDNSTIEDINNHEHDHDHVSSSSSSSTTTNQSVEITIFRPTYGFHTHAYAISKSAATTLLSKLPVVGPLDVWLADNEWFGLTVYCSMVANEGWHGTGANLISQDRGKHNSTNIAQSGRQKKS